MVVTLSYTLNKIHFIITVILHFRFGITRALGLLLRHQHQKVALFLLIDVF